jgi:hypothetical protein
MPRQARRATDHPPLSDVVTRGNLDDRLATVHQRLDDHTELAKERWEAHRAVHEAVAESLRDYKRDANEWRATLSDLRVTFIPKAEFQSEHRALEAKLHGEVATLTGIVNALDLRVDSNTSDIKDTRTEQVARRSVFSDSRNLIATAGLVFGIVASALLILDRLK